MAERELEQAGVQPQPRNGVDASASVGRCSKPLDHHPNPTAARPTLPRSRQPHHPGVGFKRNLCRKEPRGKAAHDRAHDEALHPKVGDQDSEFDYDPFSGAEDVDLCGPEPTRRSGSGRVTSTLSPKCAPVQGMIVKLRPLSAPFRSSCPNFGTATASTNISCTELRRPHVRWRLAT